MWQYKAKQPINSLMQILKETLPKGEKPILLFCLLKTFKYPVKQDVSILVILLQSFFSRKSPIKNLLYKFMWNKFQNKKINAII